MKGSVRCAAVLLAVAVLGGCAGASSTQRSACGRLQSVQLDGARILEATAVPANRGFSLTRALVGVPFLSQPASCKVRGIIQPTPDSAINFELWLPQTNWNGRFQGIGNGGFAGSIDRLSLAVALHGGYAAASTDTGHQGTDKDGAWALHHPARIADYGYRAVHETAVVSKSLIHAFYGRAPAHAYFGSASNGGREALMEAQRYPEDYDGILAGAPAFDPSDSLRGWAWNQELLSRKDYWISPAKLKTISAVVLRQCDRLDGVADGIVTDPRDCHFEPARLRCSGQDTDACLTKDQIAALERIYAGPFYPGHAWGFAPGGEQGWKKWITGPSPGAALERSYSRDFLRYLVYSDASWDIDRFNDRRDQLALKQTLGPMLDATSPDLQAFRARGGKLIIYQGWSDPALQPRMVIDYVQSVEAKLGRAATSDFLRLYMVPGLYHVIGGPGPNAFGQMPAGGTGNREATCRPRWSPGWRAAPRRVRSWPASMQVTGNR